MSDWDGQSEAIGPLQALDSAGHMEPAQAALISSFYLYIWSVKASQEMHCHPELPLKSIEGASSSGPPTLFGVPLLPKN